MSDTIKIKGAKVHNLKNIDVEIPKNKLVVITGLSGSGKSSLAFDTIYAEGQRRYVESLSSYARQFLGNQDKPDVEKIEGLAPAVAIDQRAMTHNPRSTVGTMTEIYDYLRVLYANFGVAHCPECGEPLAKQTKDQIGEQVWQMCKQGNILILAPVIKNKKGQHKQVLHKIAEAKYIQVRMDGYICPIEEALDADIDKSQKHTIEVVVNRVKLPSGKIKTIDCGEIGNNENKEEKDLFYKALINALDLGNGVINVYDLDNQKDKLFSQNLVCLKCGINLTEVEANLFSFNSPQGACEACGGLGTRLEVDGDLVIPNKKLTIAEGAIRPWARISGNAQSKQLKTLDAVAKRYDFSINTPINKLSKEQLNIVFYGVKEEEVKDKSLAYEGVFNNLLNKYRETNSSYVRQEIEKYMRVKTCSECQGQRLKKHVLGITIQDKNITEVAQMTIEIAQKFFKALSLNKKELKIAEPLIREIANRLQLLLDVGVNYLTLDRSAVTLSGGEVQKIRLATQIGSNLTGVIYVLDEPSIGLHQRDNAKLIDTLRKLQKLDNSVIVVEHDADTIMAADYVIDVGPGAGKHGGEIVAKGTPKEIIKNKESLTGDYLSGRKEIEISKKTRKGLGKNIEIIGASEFNLQDVSVKIPLGKFVCVTGVSGSGKSTLITDILSKALAQYFYKAKDVPGKHKDIKGFEYINKVVTIDQSPIGRTPRSNPATYTGVFTYIRELYAQQPEARIKGFGAGHFSFNVRGGRCETCQGDGVIKLEMNFLPDVYVPCEECKGRRYNTDALEVFFRGKNIADILEMTVDEAHDFFYDIENIKNKLKILKDVGLGYIHLGQSATTLSGGEAQRIKLATELSRRATGKTLYILDEPTIGLHFEDVKKLLKVLNKLVDKGNTVLVVEHNLDVIKSSDYIIDIGPEGGDKGGEIIAQGTPKEVVKIKRSYTGQFLQRVLK